MRLAQPGSDSSPQRTIGQAPAVPSLCTIKESHLDSWSVWRRPGTMGGMPPATGTGESLAMAGETHSSGLSRRDFVISAAATIAGSALPSLARASPTPGGGNVPLPYDCDTAPPMDT